MEISKNSWHYKIAKVGSEYGMVSNSLCPYFWQIVKGLLTVLLAVATACAVLFFMSTVFLVYLVPSIATPIAFLGALCWTMLGIVSILIIRSTEKYMDGDEWWSKPIFKLPKRNTKESKPSILLEYFRAKKEKMCPTLTFKD